jgi:hypothetical protein
LPQALLGQLPRLRPREEQSEQDGRADASCAPALLDERDDVGESNKHSAAATREDDPGQVTLSNQVSCRPRGDPQVRGDLTDPE